MATTLTCPRCGAAMILLERWNPDNGHVLCCDGCDYSEDLPVDAQLRAQAAPRLPGLT